MSKEEVRVRFAPSPTGYLHLGSARTALFNWLYARQMNGKLVLRIEDTDRERSKKEFLDEILEDLKWLGLNWDEGPIFQSERFQIYKEYANKLLDKKLAYKEGEAIIFKVEKSKVIKVYDIVHGEIVFNTDEIKDQVLIKSDGHPAYNFSCVVDDHDMNITHIIRGDDHISNTPKQLLLYEALGMKPPKLAHMPLMMGKDGAKLSKRHAAVAVFEYKKAGYFSEALSNYLMLLGWSPGENREIVSLDEAAKLFKIEDLSDVQAKFDIDKLGWINGEYVRSKDVASLAKSLKPMDKNIKKAEDKYLEKVIELYKTRFRTLVEFVSLTKSFFADDFPVEDDAKKKREKYLKDENATPAISEFSAEINKLEKFDKENIENVCRLTAEKYNIKPAVIIHLTRIAISGMTKGAGIFEMMELLGKERVAKRVSNLKQ